MAILGMGQPAFVSHDLDASLTFYALRGIEELLQME